MLVVQATGELRFEAPDTVRATLEGLGRTEDARFSPSGRRLAIACYAGAQIAVADVEIENHGETPRIAITGVELLGSDALQEPHGVDFVDEDRLAVADRRGGIQLLRRPSAASSGANGGASLTSDLVDSPGSIVVRPLRSGGHEIVVCNNWSDTVTRHRLAPTGSLTRGDIVARRHLDLPDGLALSADGQWLAVSSHKGHAVLVYANEDAGEESEPVGVLRGALYPHGLRFADDDRLLLVADAGAPYVHVFSADGGWRGARYPSASIRAVDDAAFARGRRTPEEGGPKGLDVEPQTGVVAVTCEEQPLAFFDLRAALGAGPSDVDFAQYELLVLATSSEAQARAEADTAVARAALAEVVSTKAWRLTAPARRLNALLRRVRGQGSRT